jgi:predicted DNA-binding transcriptional regulator YafY
MRASRLLSILILLQLRVRLTAEALAREFEVSVRTIYRDIDALSAAGIPVYGDRGPGGGFQLLDGYRTKLTGLTAAEAEPMVMIGLPGPAAALGLGDEAKRALGRMMASLPATGSAAAGRFAERFHVDPVDWYQSEEPVRHLPAIARAVLDQKKLAMTYESWSHLKEHEVSPLGLVLKGGAWYLVAAKGERVLTFRVSNILALAVLDESFVRPEAFDLPAWWRGSLERFERELRPNVAILRASREGLRRLAELGAHAREAVATAGAADEAGWSEVALSVEGKERAAQILLGIGPEVEVIGPSELRAQLRDYALQIAGLAEEKAGFPAARE